MFDGRLNEFNNCKGSVNHLNLNADKARRMISMLEQWAASFGGRERLLLLLQQAQKTTTRALTSF
jgi:hypothetical protein